MGGRAHGWAAWGGWRTPAPRPSGRGLSQPTPGTYTVSAGTLTATQIASAAADFPIALAQNGIYDARDDGDFAARWSSTGDLTDGIDLTDTDLPTSRLYDHLFDVGTSPTANASVTTWYLLLKLGATVAAFDAVAILGHNFGTIGGLTVSLEIADTADFGTNLTSLASWSPGTSNARLVDVTLGGGNNSYSNVGYARLKIVGSAAFTPTVGEIVLSARDQLNQTSLVGYNPDGSVSRISDFESRSGADTRYVYNHGRQMLDGSMVAKDSTDAAIITGLWSHTEHGTLPFLWIEQPNTSPSTAYWMFMSEPSLDLDTRGRGVRGYKFSLKEQGTPFFANET